MFMCVWRAVPQERSAATFARRQSLLADKEAERTERERVQQQLLKKASRSRTAFAWGPLARLRTAASPAVRACGPARL